MASLVELLIGNWCEPRGGELGEVAATAIPAMASSDCAARTGTAAEPAGRILGGDSGSYEPTAWSGRSSSHASGTPPPRLSTEGAEPPVPWSCAQSAAVLASAAWRISPSRSRDAERPPRVSAAGSHEGSPPPCEAAPSRPHGLRGSSQPGASEPTEAHEPQSREKPFCRGCDGSRSGASTGRKSMTGQCLLVEMAMASCGRMDCTEWLRSAAGLTGSHAPWYESAGSRPSASRSATPRCSRGTETSSAQTSVSRFTKASESRRCARRSIPTAAAASPGRVVVDRAAPSGVGEPREGPAPAAAAAVGDAGEGPTKGEESSCSSMAIIRLIARAVGKSAESGAGAPLPPPPPPPPPKLPPPKLLPPELLRRCRPGLGESGAARGVEGIAARMYQ